MATTLEGATPEPQNEPVDNCLRKGGAHAWQWIWTEYKKEMTNQQRCIRCGETREVNL